MTSSKDQAGHISSHPHYRSFLVVFVTHYTILINQRSGFLKYNVLVVFMLFVAKNVLKADKS